MAHKKDKDFFFLRNESHEEPPVKTVLKIKVPPLSLSFVKCFEV